MSQWVLMKTNLGTGGTDTPTPAVQSKICVLVWTPPKLNKLVKLYLQMLGSRTPCMYQELYMLKPLK